MWMLKSSRFHSRWRVARSFDSIEYGENIIRMCSPVGIGLPSGVQCPASLAWFMLDAESQALGSGIYRDVPLPAD